MNGRLLVLVGFGLILGVSSEMGRVSAVEEDRGSEPGPFAGLSYRSIGGADRRDDRAPARPGDRLRGGAGQGMRPERERGVYRTTDVGRTWTAVPKKNAAPELPHVIVPPPRAKS